MSGRRALHWRGVGVTLLVMLYAAPHAFAQPALIREAQELNDQADELYVKGHYAAGIPLAERALAIREKALGRDHLDTAASLSTLGRICTFSGDYARAKPLLQRAVSITEKSLGPDDPAVATLLNNLGNLYRLAGDFAQAQPLYKRAIRIRQKQMGPEHPETATVLLNLGNLYSETGDYAQAEPLFRQSLAIAEKTQGPEHPDTARSLNNLAKLYRDTGAYDDAEPLYRRSLAIKEKVLGPEHPDTARSLNNLAELYSATGAYAQAEPLYRRALAIREKVLGNEHPGTATSLNNLAELYRATGAYSQAEPLYRQALAISEKSLGPEHPDTADTLNNLAELYRAIGAYAKAEPLLQRALAINEKSLGPDHLYAATSLSNLAVLNWTRGEPVKALPLLQRAKAIQAKSSERFLLSGSEARKQAYLQILAKEAYKTVSFSVAVPGNDSVVLGLSGVLQNKGRVLDVMSDSMARLRQSVKAEDRELFEQLAEVANQLSILTYQGPGNLAPADYRKRIAALGGQQEKLEAELAKRSSEFRQQLKPATVVGVSRAIPADAALVEWFRYTPFDPKATDAALPAPPRYVAYVLKRDTAPAVIDIGEATAVESLVREFRLAASDSKRNDVKASAAALSNKLLGPLRAHLKDSNHLLMSPDGALNLVPFAALLDEHGEYMAKSFEITYLTSGRDLLRIDARSMSRGKAVIVANPDFGSASRLIAQSGSAGQSQRSADMDRGGLIFRPLANTALEAQDLKDLMKLGDSNVLQQLAATETSLKQLHGPRVLHVASHGFFLSDQELTAELKKRTVLSQAIPIGENPLLRSGIALTGANARRSGESDDGILTALEVAQLDLHGTELVVLSACDSGVGDVQNGEGVYGLRRALVLAGAQSQITSLWRVSDEATRTLMVDFYKRLLKGEGRSAALRHAQQDMLTNPELSHPYYWASFVAIGNWAPLPKLN